MKSKFKINTIKQVLYLVAIATILGIVKVEFFISFIDELLVDRTRLISYITLGLGSVFFYFVVIAAIMASYFTIDLMTVGSHFNLENFYKSINYFIWALMLNEISKLFITIITFNNLSLISSEAEFNEALNYNTLWVGLMELSDVVFIFCGCLTYLFVLKTKDSNVNFLEPFVSTIPLFLSFIVFRFLQ